MLHLENNGYRPSHSRELVHKARKLCEDIGATVRVARVASKFLEFDVGVEKERLNSVIDRLSPIGKLHNARHVIEEEIEKEAGIKDGIFYFNNERFWESHEAFEGVWKKCSGKEKDLVQGIILIAVAFAHCQKNDDAIGIGMLGRALEKIDDSTGVYHGINIDRIKNKAIEMRNSRKMSTFEI